MKKLLLISSAFVFLLVFFTVSSCKKTVTNTVTDTVAVYPNPIQGLWDGTFTYSAALGGGTYRFELSVLNDGTMYYQGGTTGSATYAYGTWTLSGNTFTYTAQTVNSAAGQFVQTGVATYDSSNGTLTNGTQSDPVDGVSATWTCTRVK